MSILNTRRMGFNDLVTVSARLATDTRISPAARGVFLHLVALDVPDALNVVRRAEPDPVATDAAMDELVRHGYLVRETDDAGSTLSYVLTDTPGGGQ